MRIKAKDMSSSNMRRTIKVYVRKGLEEHFQTQSAFKLMWGKENKIFSTSSLRENFSQGGMKIFLSLLTLYECVFPQKPSKLIKINT